MKPATAAVILTLAIFTFATGCASSRQSGTRSAGGVLDINRGRPYNIDWIERVVISTPVNAQVINVWRQLPAVFTALQLNGAGVVDSNNNVFGMQQAEFRGRPGNYAPSEFLNCGAQLSGPNADSYSVALIVLTHVRRDGTTSIVDTRINATAKPRSVAGERLACWSTGKLEEMIAQELIKRTAPR